MTIAPRIACAVVCVLTCAAATHAQPLSTAFTYQGALHQAGAPAAGAFDFEFRLFAAATGGSAIGTVIASDLAVTNGHFTAALDFGAAPFNGESRWLEVVVEGITLVPRQSLAAAPYALHARGVFVDSSMRVGLGTTTPTNRLSVAGDADFSGRVGIGTAPSFNGTLSVNAFNGYAVNALHTGGAGSAVYGQTVASGTAGVYGQALGTGTDSYGVLGQCGAVPGYGVYGSATSLTGTTYGVYGHAPSPAGYAGYFEGRGYFNGNVGLGVSNPMFRLHLSQDSAAKPGTNTWTVSSDRRLKKDIEPLQHSLEKLLRLRGVSFRWIDPESQGGRSGIETGLIAQEVEQVFPEWVGSDARGYKTLTVGGFEALTAEALRELRAEKDAQVAALHDENESLRKDVADLRAQMQRLLEAMERKE